MTVPSQLQIAGVVAFALSAIALTAHLVVAPSAWSTALAVLTLVVVPGLGAVVWVPPLPADLTVAATASASIAVIVVVSAVTIGVDVYSPALSAAISVALGLVALAARIVLVARTTRAAW
jgi:hypothetical protein